MKKLLILVAIIGQGCSTMTTEQTGPDGEKTRTRIVNFWDSKSELAKFRTTQTDKSQGVSVGAYNAEATSTNITALAEAIARGIASGLTPVKP